MENKEFLSLDENSLNTDLDPETRKIFLDKVKEYTKELLKDKQDFVDRYDKKDVEDILKGKAIKDAIIYIKNMKRKDIKELVIKSLTEVDFSIKEPYIIKSLKAAKKFLGMSDDEIGKLKPLKKEEIPEAISGLNSYYSSAAVYEIKSPKQGLIYVFQSRMSDRIHVYKEDGKLDSLLEKTEVINSKKYISERDINEDDWKQSDDESDMAHSQLKSIQSNASKLMNMIDNNEQLDAWVQSKLTKAQDYLQSVSDYLTGEESEIEELYKKKAKKDYDGDNEIESPEEEYKGVKDKAIKNAKGLAEIIAKKLKESSYKAPSNSKEAQSLKKGDVIGSGETVVSVSSGAKTPSGKVNVTLEKNGKTRTAVWGKSTKIGVKKPEDIK
jgi:hypothetical protein